MKFRYKIGECTCGNIRVLIRYHNTYFCKKCLKILFNAFKLFENSNIKVIYTSVNCKKECIISTAFAKKHYTKGIDWGWNVYGLECYTRKHILLETFNELEDAMFVINEILLAIKGGGSKYTVPECYPDDEFYEEFPTLTRFRKGD